MWDLNSLLEKKNSLKDISIAPAVISDICSRNECSPYIFRGRHHLPLFTAPMATTVCYENMELFDENRIIPILPRNIDFGCRTTNSVRGKWSAYSMKEIEKIISGGTWFDKEDSNKLFRFCIDVANGHMQCLLDLCKELRSKLPNSVIMTGNIANPETYRHYCQNNINLVRVGIGNGSQCLTSTQTGIHYPLVSLLQEIYKIKKERQRDGLFCTKIIADGGMKNYSDIIKCLALGADYVMVGTLFSKMLETPGEIFDIKPEGKYSVGDYFEYPDTIRDLFENGNTLQKETFGMASKRGQSEIFSIDGKSRLRTSEGKVSTVNIEYSMSQWVENFVDYFKSAMSYTNKKKLEDFIGNVEILYLSNNSSTSFNS
jgi:hypothetical protein